ncbi:21733_t:CDS:2, partial [Racocetra persica]
VTPAFHLTQLLEEKIYSVKNPNLNVNLELTKDQHDQANQLLMENINIFSENILEDRQSKELGQTDIIYVFQKQIPVSKIENEEVKIFHLTAMED